MMPDVIIKGMEMPKSCNECQISKNGLFYRWCGIDVPGISDDVEGYTDSRPSWCPLYPAPEWHDVTDPPKRDGSYYATRHSVYGDFQTLLDYSVADDSWFEYDADYEDDFGILEHDDVVRWHDLPEPLDGGGGE